MKPHAQHDWPNPPPGPRVRQPDPPQMFLGRKRVILPVLFVVT